MITFTYDVVARSDSSLFVERYDGEIEFELLHFKITCYKIHYMKFQY